MKKYLLIICSAIIFCSCDDYLTLSDPNNITEESFYSTEAQMGQAITSTYAAMINFGTTSGMDVTNYLLLSEIRSDNYEPVNQNGESDYYIIGRFMETTSTSVLESVWANLYEMIYYANKVVNSIDNVSFEDEDLKSQYLGEAKFLRAYAYFQMIKIFGKAPLTTDALSITEAQNLGLSSRDDLYDLVVSDLTDAEDLLPASYDTDDLGRVTKWSSYALLGRVYLYRAGYPLNETQYLDNAKECFETVIAQEGTYITWCDNYANLFSMDYENTYNLFEIQHASSCSSGTALPDYIQPSYGTTDPRYNANGGAFNSSNRCSVSDSLIALYDDNDVRFDATIDTTYINDNDTEQNSNFYIKFRPENVTIDSHYDWPINFPIIRYADVLLMYAEVLNEQGETSSAVPYLNRIRERAGLEDISSSVSSSEFLTILKKERRLEFAGEGLRWWDLVRWDDGVDVMNSFFEDLGDDYDVTVTQDDYTYPIPDEETSAVGTGVYD